MSMTDPIADMLTRVRNAQAAKKIDVSMPASKLKHAVAKVLMDEGYVGDIDMSGDGSARTMTVALRYHEGHGVIDRLERVSRPGLRVYKSAEDLPRVEGGLGVAIVSTSKGVMSDRQARSEGQGGEVLCIVS